MSDVTLYHNPACSKSRKVLELIRQAGHEPVVIEYLKQPPDRAALQALAAALNAHFRSVLRESAEPYAELGLADPKWSDDELIDFVCRYPALLNRPIVITPLGARLCRPEETVADILPQPA